ncbi:MAG: outer membrane lipoprotein-sorting protein [Deltaproteobacteria bacterium]|nr:outer membrane lipoprotein-sorting protein [Deltaproteobacteria bacterium]
MHQRHQRHHRHQGQRTHRCLPGARALAICALAVIGSLLPLVSGAEAPTGRQIMEWVDERDTGDDGISDMEMILIDKRGKQRVRKIRTFSKKLGESGDDDYGIMFFLSPADVKDTGFLTYDYDDPEKDDDQWLFLPALKKTKRIAAGDKSGSFMGSDFSYADMSERPLDRYDFTLMKEDEVDGHKVWQVEAVPKTKEEIDETGYTRRISFVRQDNHVVIRSVGWLKKGKRLRYFEVKSLELIDDIWVPTEMQMTTKKNKTTLHKTVLKNSNIKFNQDLTDDYFTVRQLEKGL